MRIHVARPGIRARRIKLAAFVCSFLGPFAIVLSVLFAPVPATSVAVERALYKDVSVYMLVLLQNPKNLSRILHLDRVWGSDFRHLARRSLYRVAASEGSLPVPGIAFPSRRHQNSDMRLLIYFEDHLRHFLKATRFRWYIRTTEDCFVNLKRLPPMIAELERRHNPLRDIVIAGQAVDINEFVSMVHGGAGWIMSRAACKFYMAHHKAIRRVSAQNDQADDLIPQAFMRVAKLATEEVNHFGFLGSPLDDKTVGRFRKLNFSGIGPCPSLEVQRWRRRFLVPVDPIVLWHSGRKDMFPMMEGYQIARELPPGLVLRHIHMAVTLCNGSLPPWPATIEQGMDLDDLAIKAQAKKKRRKK
jgi:hypothetical protein